MIMKNNFRSEIIKQINNITSFFFLYSIFTISLSPSFFFKKQSSLNDSIGFLNNNLKEEKEIAVNDQKALIKKLHFDLHHRKIIHPSEDNFVTQISINKEGKIIGYKPTKLRLLSYSLEKQLVILLKKNVLLNKSGKSIYWLDITNKY
jgi:hypothetical protein